jgi:alcohol dehydrogenase class IV
MGSYWVFNSPYISFGENALDGLDTIKGDRIFIVTDSMIVKLGLINYLTDKLKKFKRKWQIFDQIEPDPKEETILEGAKQCQAFKPDLIIGLGGGSSLDGAKAIWVLYENPEMKIDEINPFVHLGLGTKANMVAIPTTSGTGAEATWAVIITRTLPDQSFLKLELANKEVVPTYAILDPVFTKTLPTKLTAATGFDAMAHIYEGILSKWKNDFSDGMAIKGVQLIRKYLPRAVKDGKDLIAREKMHNAACMAGLSFGNSQINIGHSLGHALGAVFHKMHGHCVGVFLPYVLQFQINDPNSKKPTGGERENVISILGEFSKMLGISKWDETDENAAQLLIADIKSLQKQIEFPQTLEEMGISAEELSSNLDALVEKTMESPSVVLSPRVPTTEELKKIINCALKGEDVSF